MIKKMLLALGIVAIASTTSMAAVAPSFSVSGDKKITIVQHPADHFTPPLMHKPKLTAIYSNVGTKYPKGEYFCCYGATISGSTSPIGEQIWLATAFTPTANATISEVDAAVAWVTGTNGVVLSVYSDNGGVPGTALWSGNAKNLGTFGDCCALAVGNVKGGLPVTAGTQYWLTVTTDKKEANEWAAWAFNTTDQVDQQTIAVNTGSGWSPSIELPGLSFGIYGQ